VLRKTFFSRHLRSPTCNLFIIFYFTSYCWYHKPQDLSRANDSSYQYACCVHPRKIPPHPEERWHQTPLDFLSARNGSSVAYGATTSRSYTIYIFQYSPDPKLSLGIPYPPRASCVWTQLRSSPLLLAYYILLACTCLPGILVSLQSSAFNGLHGN